MHPNDNNRNSRYCTVIVSLTNLAVAMLYNNCSVVKCQQSTAKYKAT